MTKLSGLITLLLVFGEGYPYVATETIDIVRSSAVGTSTDDLWSRIVPAGSNRYWVMGRWNTTWMSYYGVVAMVDSMGDTLWTRKIDYFFAAACDASSDNGLILVGPYITDSLSTGIPLIKVNSHGGLDDSMVICKGSLLHGANNVRRISDRYVFWGVDASSGTSIGTPVLACTDASFAPLWSRRYGRGTSDLIYSVTRDAQGGIIVMGNTSPSSNLSCLWIMKLSAASGEAIWDNYYYDYRCYSGSNNDLIMPLSDGRFAACATDLKERCCLITIDAQGNLLTSASYPLERTYPVGAAVRNDTFAVAAFHYVSSSMQTSTIVLEMLPSGKMGRTGALNEYFRGIAPCGTGAYLLCGATAKGNPYVDALICKTGYNPSPRITFPPNGACFTTAMLDSFSVTIAVADSFPNERITFRQLEAPVQGLKVDTLSGAIGWIPQRSQVGKAPVTVAAFDRLQQSDTVSFFVEVVPDSQIIWEALPQSPAVCVPGYSVSFSIAVNPRYAAPAMSWMINGRLLSDTARSVALKIDSIGRYAVSAVASAAGRSDTALWLVSCTPPVAKIANADSSPVTEDSLISWNLKTPVKDGDFLSQLEYRIRLCGDGNIARTCITDVVRGHSVRLRDLENIDTIPAGWIRCAVIVSDTVYRVTSYSSEVRLYLKNASAVHSRARRPAVSAKRTCGSFRICDLQGRSKLSAQEARIHFNAAKKPASGIYILQTDEPDAKNSAKKLLLK